MFFQRLHKRRSSSGEDNKTAQLPSSAQDSLFSGYSGLGQVIFIEGVHTNYKTWSARTRPQRSQPASTRLCTVLLMHNTHPWLMSTLEWINGFDLLHKYWQYSICIENRRECLQRTVYVSLSCFFWLLFFFYHVEDLKSLSSDWASGNTTIQKCGQLAKMMNTQVFIAPPSRHSPFLYSGRSFRYLILIQTSSGVEFLACSVLLLLLKINISFLEGWAACIELLSNITCFWWRALTQSKITYLEGHLENATTRNLLGSGERTGLFYFIFLPMIVRKYIYKHDRLKKNVYSMKISQT